MKEAVEVMAKALEEALAGDDLLIIDDWRVAMQIGLTAYQQHLSAKGMKVVPREPTEIMIGRMAEADDANDGLRGIWLAGWDSAPHPPGRTREER